MLVATGTLAGFLGWVSDNAWLVAAAAGLGLAGLALYLRPNAPANGDESPSTPSSEDMK